MEIKFNIQPDVLNANGVIFEKSALDEAMKKFNERIAEHRAVVYTDYGSTLLQNVCALIKSLRHEDNCFIAEIEPLKNQNGIDLVKKLQGVTDDFRLVTMSTAKQTKDEDGRTIIQEFDIEYCVIKPKSECA